MIRAILDFLWPEYCPCGEQKIGGKCVLDVELGAYVNYGYRKITRVITYVLRCGFGVPPGYVVLGLGKMPRRAR